MNYLIEFLNESKIFAGCIMLLMNIGGRYILNELPSNADDIFNRPMIRLFIIFSIVFVATKDIKSSILLTLLFILFFKFILDENSKFCILDKKTKGVSKTELFQAYNTIKKYKEQKQKMSV